MPAAPPSQRRARPASRRPPRCVRTWRAAAPPPPWPRGAAEDQGRVSTWGAPAAAAASSRARAEPARQPYSGNKVRTRAHSSPQRVPQHPDHILTGVSGPARTLGARAGAARGGARRISSCRPSSRAPAAPARGAAPRSRRQPPPARPPPPAPAPARMRGRVRVRVRTAQLARAAPWVLLWLLTQLMCQQACAYLPRAPQHLPGLFWLLT